ncbi:Multidrug resistance-associated protein 6 [Coemansia sp. RSA 1200]|nr:Multidrug resistance-associated protein 6 [Coemansia sp. RSA 1200]
MRWWWWFILPPLVARSLIPRIILASSVDSIVIGKHRQQQRLSSSSSSIAVLLAMAVALLLALLPVGVAVTMAVGGGHPIVSSMALQRDVFSLCGTGGGVVLLVLDFCLFALQLAVLFRSRFLSLGLSGLSRITYFWVFQYVNKQSTFNSNSNGNSNGNGGGSAVAGDIKRLPTSVSQDETLRLFTQNWHRLTQAERNHDKYNGGSGSGAILANAIVRTFAKDLCVSSILQLAVYASQLAIPVLVAQMLSHLSQANQKEESSGVFGGFAAYSATSSNAGAAIRALVLYSVTLLMAAVVEQNQIDLCDKLALKIHITLAASVHRSMLETPGRTIGSDTASENSSVAVYTTGVEHTKTLGKHIVKLCGDIWLPLRVVGGLYMFYSQVGWAIFPGISFILLYLPLRRTFLQRRTREQAAAGTATATRVSLLARLIDNIVPLRLLNWDTLVAGRIQKLREADELCSKRNVNLANSLLSLARTACRSCGPIVSLFVYSAGILYFSGRNGGSDGKNKGSVPGWVSVQQVYVVQAMLRELFPLVIDVPHAFDGWWAARLPYSHISRALSCSSGSNNRNSNGQQISLENGDSGGGGMAVCIRNQSYAWSAAESSGSGSSAHSRFALRDVSVSASAGQLICVVGKVGSGKSSLLSAILGEMPHHVSDGNSLSSTTASATTPSNASHAYVPQTAWLMEGTIRANITLGVGYDSEWFGRVVEACELAHDIEHQWAMGDLTVVGANGSTVSGGQRMRIALARAVYSRVSSAVYLLDDVLSMVDAQVGRRIVDNVLCGPTALLHGTTRIIVSDNSHALLAKADAIWVVVGGSVRAMRPSAYFLSDHYVPSEPLRGEAGSTGGEPVGFPLATPPASICSAVLLSPEQTKMKEEEEVKEKSGAQLHQDNHPISAANGNTGAGYLEPVRYLVRLCGWAPVAMHIITVALQCVASRNAQLWLAKQIPIFSTESTYSIGPTGDNNAAGSQPSVLHRHFVLCVVWWAADILLEFASQLWTDVVWQRSMFVKSHRQLLRSVVDAPLRFFQPPSSSSSGGGGGEAASATTGRVLELFTASQADIDTHMPRQVASVATFAVKLMFESWVILTFHPALVTIILIVVTAMWLIMRATRRPLALFIAEISAAAPVIDHQFHESANGAAIFRAFGQTAYADCKLRAALGSYARAQRAQDCVETWIDLTMALLRESANIVAFAIALLAINQRAHSSNDPASAGAAVVAAAVHPAQMSLVTLCVTFLLARLQHLVRHSHALRTSMARASKYIGFTRIESERTRNRRAFSALLDPPDSAAADVAGGSDIVFDHVFATYASGNGWALANMTFRLTPGQHVGIVGRTGSGKSSIAMALFGLLELSSGSITVGGRDIREFDPRALRSQMGIVPQDPQTLPASSIARRGGGNGGCSAAVRENLDPLGLCTSNDLESALCAVGLDSHHHRRSKEMLQLLDESPESWSVGQKQKLALARILLLQSNTSASSQPPISVVVLDEATAHIDSHESAALLRTIRRRLDPQCIVVTIAHRIDAVMDCHNVLVVKDGCVCESGAPRDLIARENSHFADLAWLDRPVDPASYGHRASADAGPPTPPHEKEEES